MGLRSEPKQFEFSRWKRFDQPFADQFNQAFVFIEHNRMASLEILGIPGPDVSRQRPQLANCLLGKRIVLRFDDPIDIAFSHRLVPLLNIRLIRGPGAFEALRGRDFQWAS